MSAVCVSLGFSGEVGDPLRWDAGMFEAELTCLGIMVDFFVVLLVGDLGLVVGVVLGGAAD